MKKILLAVVIILSVAGCKKNDQHMKNNFQFASPKGAAHQGAAKEDPTGMSGTGKVIETMNSGGYTYANVDVGGTKYWVAGQETQVAVGDTVSFSHGMPMPNFRSNTLKRTFDMVYFVPEIQAGGMLAAAANSPHGTDGGNMPRMGTPLPETVKVANIKKAEGGKTIAEIFAQKGALVSKEVVVRGQVVKYNAGIMGRNWVHIQDGSGASGTNDLTVTSTDTTAVGKTVLVRGTIATDQDFGGGYQYSVIVEGAKITEE